MKFYEGKNAIRELLPEILHDESRLTSGIPDAVYFPQTVSDVREAVLAANRANKHIALIGGKTGVAGGSVPTDGCVALCFSDMNRIHSVAPRESGPLLTCDPGVTLAAIETFLQNPSSQSGSVAGSDLAEPGKWLYAPDPTESSAQLGGTIATNASGARSLLFGSTRKHVLELLIVFANGDTLTIRRGDYRETNGVFVFGTDQGTKFTIRKPTYPAPSTKNSSGYFVSDNMDLIDLFVGSEGTLGIIARCSIGLIPLPHLISGLSFFPNRASAFGAAAFLRKEGRVCAVEYFDKSALGLLEMSRNSLPFDLPEFPSDKRNAVYWEYIDDAEQPFDDKLDLWEDMLTRNESSFESTWSGSTPSEIDRLKSLRHAVPEAINSAIARYKQEFPDIRKVSTDTALPASAFERVFEEYVRHIGASGLEFAVFGHLGDYHLHINLIPHTSEQLTAAKQLYQTLMQMTVACGGSVSAEHGIGKLKTRYLRMMYGDDARAEMMALKSALDPLWMLNRGTMFEYPPE